MLHADEFQAFKPDFDADFATHWLAAIDLTDTEESGSARVAQFKEDTGEVNDHMAQMQTLFYQVGRAFSHNAARLDKYGHRIVAGLRR